MYKHSYIIRCYHHFLFVYRGKVNHYGNIICCFFGIMESGNFMQIHNFVCVEKRSVRMTHWQVPSNIKIKYTTHAKLMYMRLYFIPGKLSDSTAN